MPNKSMRELMNISTKLFESADDDYADRRYEQQSDARDREEDLFSDYTDAAFNDEFTALNFRDFTLPTRGETSLYFDYATEFNFDLEKALEPDLIRVEKIIDQIENQSAYVPKGLYKALYADGAVGQIFEMNGDEYTISNIFKTYVDTIESAIINKDEWIDANYDSLKAGFKDDTYVRRYY